MRNRAVFCSSITDRTRLTRYNLFLASHATTNISERIEVYHETQPDSPIRESCSQNCEPVNAMNRFKCLFFLVFRIISHAIVKFRKLYILFTVLFTVLYRLYYSRNDQFDILLFLKIKKMCICRI